MRNSKKYFLSIVIFIFLFFVVSCDTTITKEKGLHFEYDKSARFISHEVNGGGFGFTNYEGYVVTKYDGDETSVEIPETFDDGVHGVLNVSRVGTRAFLNNLTIEEVKLPCSINYIDDNAFGGCKSPSKINLDKVLALGPSSFTYCVGLKNIDLASCVQIQHSALSMCTGFTSEEGTASVRFGEKLQIIDIYAFLGSNLSSVILPASLKFINHYAFTVSSKSIEVSYLGTS